MKPLSQGKPEYSEIGTERSVYECASLLVAFYEQRNNKTRYYESENNSDYAENYQLRIKCLRYVRIIDVHKKTAGKRNAENEFFRLRVKCVGKQLYFLKNNADKHQQ